MSSSPTWQLASNLPPIAFSNGGATIRLAATSPPSAGFAAALPAQVAELTDRPLKDAIRRELARSDEVSAYRAAKKKITDTEKDRDQLQREIQRAALDLQDALAGSLTGEKLAATLASLETKRRELTDRLAALERGLAILRESAEEARERAKGKADSIAASLFNEFRARLVSEHKAAIGELEKAAAKPLTNLAIIHHALATFRDPSGLANQATSLLDEVA